MTAPLTLTLVPVQAVDSLHDAAVLRGFLYELDDSPTKRSFFLDRVWPDLFMLMRAGGLEEVVTDFEGDHTRLDDPDLFVRLMRSEVLTYVRDWLVPLDLEPLKIARTEEPLEDAWREGLIEKLVALSGWLEREVLEGDVLLLISNA